jgi:hypothetical protein
VPEIRGDVLLAVLTCRDVRVLEPPLRRPDERGTQALNRTRTTERDRCGGGPGHDHHGHPADEDPEPEPAVVVASDVDVVDIGQQARGEDQAYGRHVPQPLRRRDADQQHDEPDGQEPQQVDRAPAHADPRGDPGGSGTEPAQMSTSTTSWPGVTPAYRIRLSCGRTHRKAAASPARPDHVSVRGWLDSWLAGRLRDSPATSC